MPALPAVAKTRKVQCKPGYQFYKKLPRRLEPTWSTVTGNAGGSTNYVRVTVEKSGKVETHVSKSVKATAGGGFPFFQASIEGQFGTEAVKSTTTTIGQTYVVTVPAHRTVRTSFGVYTNRFRGLVLTKNNPDPGMPPRLWPVFPPPNCHLYVAEDFTTTVATSDTGFHSSKPRRISG